MTTDEDRLHDGIYNAALRYCQSKGVVVNAARVAHAMLDAAEFTVGDIIIEQRAKLSAANLGKKHSEETRAKISSAQVGKKRSEETRAKIRAAWVLRKAVANNSGAER